MKTLYFRKKASLISLAMCIILLVTSSAAYAEEVANVTFNGEDPLSGWTIGSFSTAADDQGAEYEFIKNPDGESDEDKCLHVSISGKKSSTNEDEIYYPFIQKNFTTGSVAEISFSFKINNENATASMPFRKICSIFNVSFQTSGNLNFFYIDDYGNLCYHNPTTWTTYPLGVKIANNVSYKYKAVIRNTDHTFDVYLDGVKVNSEPIAFPNETKGGFKFTRIMPGGKKGFHFYIDDIKVETYNPMDVSSTSATEDANVKAFTVNFVNPVDDKLFSDECITLMQGKNEVPKENYKYAVSENVLRIDFTQKLSYETDYTLILKNVYDTDGRALEEKTIAFTTCKRPPLKAEVIGIPMTCQRASVTHNSDSRLINTIWKKSALKDGDYVEFARGESVLLTSELKNMYVKATAEFSDGSSVQSDAFGMISENGNISLNAGVETDSELSGYEASLMLDGDSDTRWAGASKSGYINIDLGSLAQINTLEMDSMGTRFKTYSVLCSEDKLSWVALAEAEEEFVSQYDKKTYSHSFNTVSARYIKIKYEVFSDAGAATLYEIRAFNSEAVSPIISAPYISGELSAGSVLTAECTAIPDKAEFSYVWEMSDKLNGEYTAVSGLNSKKISIPKACEGKYLRVRARAKNADGEYSTEALSSPIGPIEQAKPSAPYAYGLKILGNAYVNETLEFTYIYEDVNDDPEDKSEYRLLLSKNKDMSESSVLKSGKATANDKITYKLLKSDADNYIALEITPISVNEPKTGIAILSDAVFVRDVPEATDVKAKLSSDGKSLVGEYNYSHANGDGELGSSYKWYRGSSQNGSFEEIKAETGKSYKLKSTDFGKYFKFEVTPACENAPKIGKTVLSDALYVAEKGGGGNSKSSSSSGGGYLNKNITVSEESKTNENEESKIEIFSDISGHWAKDSIEALYKLGLVNGVGENRYDPEGFVTKAELTAVLMRAFDVEGDNECEFFDVLKSDWFYNEVTRAASSGIVSGFLGRFEPNAYVTREQAAKIITELYWKKVPPLTKAAPTADFKDISEVSEWALEYVNACVKYELMNGVSDEYFSPKSNITRAQMTVIVKRLTDKILAEE